MHHSLQVVDMLGDAEDALWELDDDTVVASVQEALARMCEVCAVPIDEIILTSRAQPRRMSHRLL